VNPIRVLIAEDHRTVREGVKMLLQAQPDMEIVGEADDGRAAVRLAQELNPDVLLMDISMPEWNGLKATEKLREVCPKIKVLTLTRHADKAYLQQLLQAGAAGYVLKQSPPSELLHAIRAVAAGSNYLDPAITGLAMGGYFRKQSKEQTVAEVNLSDREAEVLRMIAWGHSNKEIAAHLSLSVKTIEAHKANAMRKLEMRSRIDIVRYAILQGWLKDSDE